MSWGLREQIKELREALAKIANETNNQYDDVVGRVNRIAREALDKRT